MKKFIAIFSVSIVCYIALAFFSCTGHLNFSSRTERWSEDAILQGGRLVKVEREVGWTTRIVFQDPFFGLPTIPHLSDSWPDKFWLKFVHPDTKKTIIWQGKQRYSPVLLDIVDRIPYLVLSGHGSKKTEAKYGCPELPYIYLKYQEGILKKWIPVPLEMAPSILKKANLSPEYPGFSKRGSITESISTAHRGGRSRRDMSLLDIQKIISRRETQTDGFFQQAIPKSYKEWDYYNEYKESYRYMRKRKDDCRPPPEPPSPNLELLQAYQDNIDAELVAFIVPAKVVSVNTEPELITKEKFANLKGKWTIGGYLTKSCQGIIERVEPLKQCSINQNGSDSKLIGYKMITQMASVDENSIQIAKPNGAQKEGIVCNKNTIIIVERKDKDNLTIHLFDYDGKLVDTLRVNLPNTEEVIKSSSWGDLWLGDVDADGNLTVALTDYTYSGVASDGGTINKLVERSRSRGRKRLN